MKYLHALKQDLNKTIINLGFAGAALMTCMIDSWNTTENYYVDAVTGEVTKISLRNPL